MKRIAFGVVLCAASALSSVSLAETYSVSAYTAAVVQNNWSVSRVPVGVDEVRYANDSYYRDLTLHTYAYTVSNAVTGQTMNFNHQSYGSSGVGQVNTRGDVLITDGLNGYPRTLTLWSNGKLASIGRTASYGALYDDGSVKSELYMSSGSYAGGLYVRGSWHFVAEPFAPGSSSVAGVNSADWTLGTVAQSFTAGEGSSAVLVMPGSSAVNLPGVAGFTDAGFKAGAGGLNDSNVVVGWQSNFGAATGRHPIYGYTTYASGDPFAFIWDASNGSRDLNNLIDPTSSLFGKVHLSRGLSVDNLGTIIASGYLLDAPTQLMSFQLSAVPELDSMSMMGLGLLGIGGLLRRSAARQATAQA